MEKTRTWSSTKHVAHTVSQPNSVTPPGFGVAFELDLELDLDLDLDLDVDRDCESSDQSVIPTE